jgi:hypothetical protein
MLVCEICALKTEVKILQQQNAELREKEFAACSKHHEFIEEIGRLEQQVNTLAGEQEYAKRQAILWNDKAVTLKEQVNTLTEALVKIRDGHAVECGGHLSKSEMREIADKALQSIKESPREDNL